MQQGQAAADRTLGEATSKVEAAEQQAQQAAAELRDYKVRPLLASGCSLTVSSSSLPYTSRSSSIGQHVPHAQVV